MIKYLHSNNSPANAKLENHHAGQQATLDAVHGLCSTGNRVRGDGGVGGAENACGVRAAGKTEAVGHVEEDVDVGVHAAEVLGAGTHGEYGNVG